MHISIVASAALFAVFSAACTSAPFSYAQDRCTGQQNQCQLDCTGLDDGPARSACIQRCYSVENKCTATGYDGSGASLASERGAGDARSRSEKEAAYEAWRAQKMRERAASDGDVEIQIAPRATDEQ